MNGEFITVYNYPEIYKWLFENVQDFLKTRDNYIYRDGCIDVLDRVVLKNECTKIEYPFGVVSGSFSCEGCYELKTIINSPKEVGGYFSCYGCRNLISLKGSPRIIKGNFNLTYCDNLIEFDTSIELVGGDMIYYMNDVIKSIKGFPKKVVGRICLYDDIFTFFGENKKHYNHYKQLWYDLLNSISDEEKFEYLNNYSGVCGGMTDKLVIPKEVVDVFKISFLLKEY